MRFLSVGFEGNGGWFCLQKSDEVEQLVGADDVRRALHAAGAKMRVLEPFAGQGLFADLT
jgi:hypothetical protein